MSNPGGIPPITVRLPAGFQNATQAIRGALPLQGVVVGSPSGPALQVNGTRIPLPNSVTWPLGQVVEVRVARRGTTTELRLAPQSETEPHQPVVKSPSAEQTIRGLLNEQGTKASASWVRLLSATGGHLPLTADTIGALVRLFAGRTRTAGEQSRFNQIVEELVATGTLTGDDGALIMRALEANSVRSAAMLVSLLKQMRARAGKPIEAELAKVLQDGQSIEAALRNPDRTAQVLRNLLRNDDVVRFLRETGQWAEFRAFAEHVLDRLIATHMQNTAGLEHPYVFIDVPFTLEGFIDSAHFHFWIEDDDGKSADQKEESVVALDLRMTRLGDLWISLHVHQEYCSCRVLATSDGIVETLRAASGELEQILNGLGFSEVGVEIGMWDGDRVRETADFMRPLSRLDTSV